jgi:hypothetical protein
MSLYETVTGIEVFDNRQKLERYCQADVTVLREQCSTFPRHFLQICNVDLFLECVTKVSV